MNHSFDPCVTWAVHLADEKGEELLRPKVR